MLTRAAALAIIFAAIALAQPAFEVASIRRNTTGSTNTNLNLSGGRLTITNGSIKTLIRNAYDILPFQLAAEPHWLDTETYDIIATTGTPAKIPPDQLKLLLQTLLADRFHLKLHWETREASVYVLLPAKNGPKLKPAPDPHEPSINTRKAAGDIKMQATCEPISILTNNLGNQLGHFVIDKTGLSGVYDWILEWDPDPAPDSPRPSLPTALQEQLGLKLEPQKGPLPVLVIDTVDRASEN